MSRRLPHPPSPTEFKRMNTAEVRSSFLLDCLFEPGQIRTCYSDIDRAFVGGAVPAGGRLQLEAPDDLASDCFTMRRELGIVNLGGTGTVFVNQTAYGLEHRDTLYVGRGSATIYFCSEGAEEPAAFYFVSYPAHMAYPAVRVGPKEAQMETLGSAAGANRRTIRRYIRPGAVETCQLTLGITDLEDGSVWNTMPVHRHSRRSEIYLYFGLRDEDVVFHYLGEPDETRHMAVRNLQGVLSPGWSIHAGVGTASYSFVWAMGGENREFSDMDHVPMKSLA